MNRHPTAILLLIFCLFLLPAGMPPASAEVYTGGEGLVGLVGSHSVLQGESLIEIARAYDLGYNEIVAANPALDPFAPEAGAAVVIPSARIVPEWAAEGTIVVNLSEMRLYYRYRRGGTSLLATFPVGVGSEGRETPLGSFRVTEKEANPAWHVPLSVKKENPRLPDVVPPGPDNPLGTHALRLSASDILIHGTNRPWGVGRLASHGCIRLYPEDIGKLFKLVPLRTRVMIVREPLKVGAKGDRVYLEAHRDAYDTRDYMEEATRLLVDRGVIGRVSMGKLVRALGEKSGVPVDITR